MVEVLVVIGIIAVLLSMLLPMIGRARQSSATTACLSNLRQIGQAFQFYVAENNYAFPTVSKDYVTYGFPELYISGGTSPVVDESGKFSPQPKPPERALSRYFRPSIRGGVLGGREYQSVYEYDVFKCPADAGFDLHEFQDDAAFNPLWEYSGSSYKLNLYVRALGVDTVIETDIDAARRIQSGRANRIPNPTRFILFYEPPAQLWPYGELYSPSAKSPVKVFRWHNSKNTGSFLGTEAGPEPIYSNILFADGRAATVDFSASFIRSGGAIVKQDRTANNTYQWYASTKQ